MLPSQHYNASYLTLMLPNATVVLNKFLESDSNERSKLW